MAAYIQHLGPLPFEVAKAGIERVVNHSKFFPSWAELRDAIRQVHRDVWEDPQRAWVYLWEHKGEEPAEGWPHPALGNYGVVLRRQLGDGWHEDRCYGDFISRYLFNGRGQWDHVELEDYNLTPTAEYLTLNAAPRLRALPGGDRK